VLQEAPDEFFGGNSHHLLWLLLVPVIFPGEGDLASFQRQEATVGDGHAMGVASQVFQHVLRTAEGGFGVNYPLLLFEGGQVAGKSCRVAQPFHLAEELELAGGVSLFQGFQKQAAEQTAEHLHGQQVSAAAVNPAIMIGR
jgi:hypothetical protein